ncbi:hypothetical protein CRG98_039754 [Punica granatum]|uniref:CCHC-type domain-containing protein n=1 Tax=Punica granatum TaxID=22663 RepID=A0A2I0I765_PUNGR|nr:hypothetical protein CRG98_039754 [Punica granatum]
MEAYDMIVYLRQLYQEQARHERFEGTKKAKGASKCDLGALKPKANVAKDDYCFHCGNTGHWKRNYDI